MVERPFIFSAPMVRAILDGRKTQTRRIIMPQPSQPFCGISTDGVKWWTNDDDTGVIEPLRVPYAVGDLLWVREACALWMNPEGKVVLPPDGDGPAYRASMTDTEWRALRHDQRVMAGIACGATERSTGNWVVRSPRFMPRWASRISLKVTGVRVQRLQEISEGDAQSEGARPAFTRTSIPDYPVTSTPSYRWGFEELWASIHGPGSWEENSWVAAISFRRVSHDHA